MNPLASRLISTLVTSVLLWLMGILAAKNPSLSNLAQTLVDIAGGMTVVSVGIAGFVGVALLALYTRVAGYWKLNVAAKLPSSTPPSDVERIYKAASYHDVLTMHLPTTAKAASMLASQKK